MKDLEELGRMVARAIENSQTQTDISPAWIATEVLVVLGWTVGGGLRRAHPMIYQASHLCLREVARQQLRRHDPVEEAREAMRTGVGDDLFPDTLQWRYPIAKQDGDQPLYRLRDELTDDDVAFNSGRMRRMSVSLARHADALDVWHAERRRTA